MRSIPVPRTRNLRSLMPRPLLPWRAGPSRVQKPPPASTEVLLLWAALLASEERLATDDDTREAPAA